jgi:hypothetical protein
MPGLPAQARRRTRLRENSVLMSFSAKRRISLRFRSNAQRDSSLRSK